MASPRGSTCSSIPGMLLRDGGVGPGMGSTVEIQSHRERWEPSRRAAARAADDRVAALLRADGPLALARRAELSADPRFPATVRRAAGRLVDLHEGHRLLNLIVNDRGRFLVSIIALDLHFRRDSDGAGLTPGRLRRACRETGTCSPARASALLALMRLGDFVRPAEVAGDRRRREFTPTEKLIASLRERWRCNLECAAPFLPEAWPALAALDNTAFFGAMVREACAYYYAGFRPLDHAPALRLFSERSGGMFVLLALLAAEEGEGADEVPIKVSVSHLARRIGSSRTHVIKLLNDAAAAGLLSRPDASGVVLHTPLRKAFHDFIAVGYLFLVHCATRARGPGGHSRSGVGATSPG